jgi:hypothetical protein
MDDTNYNENNEIHYQGENQGFGRNPDIYKKDEKIPGRRGRDDNPQDLGAQKKTKRLYIRRNAKKDKGKGLDNLLE